MSILDKALEQNDFLYLEDGFLYFWPKNTEAYSAHNLRELADYLDQINEKWQADIERYFKENPEKESDESCYNARRTT